uniref:Uncharacterized protein n=1 Tax=Tanacetum cinerariifolium TaxID=118510 RepID=A0A699GTS6_TANCI|nr:hypothetical protein [Tanacetum cinerariifolium]
MTDYYLWEVILNGNSPTPTRVVDGVVQPVAPTTAEQRLAKKNELKARGTLLMGLPDNHQLKFNIYNDAKSLMEAIEKRFGGNKETKKVQKTLLKQQYENFTGLNSESLDQIHDRIQKLISQLEILGESLSQEDINMKFLRSLPTESMRQRLRVYLLLATLHKTLLLCPLTTLTAPMSQLALLLVFLLSNSPQLDNDDLKQIDADDLEEMDLKWKMAMLTIRAGRGHFARECRSPRDTRNKDTQKRNVPVETSTSNALVSQCNGVGRYDWSFQADKEPTNYALMAFTSSSSPGSDSEAAPSTKPCLESIEARLVVYEQNENVFERDIKLLKLDVMLKDNALVELRKKFEKSKKEKDDSESDESVPTSPVHDRYKSGERYHVVPPPYTGAFMPHKHDLVFHDAHTVSETVPNVINVHPKPTKDLSYLNRPSAPIIEDWVSNSKDESEGEPMPTQKAPSFVQTSKHVKTPRTSVKPVEHPTPADNLRNAIPKSRSHRHRYVAFGGNPKGGKITGKDTECVVLSSDFKLPDDNYVLLRVPRENNMSNVDLKNIFTGSKDPQNKVTDVAFDDKEPESEVYVSPRVRDLTNEFEEFSDNSTNGVNAAEDITYSDDEEDVGAEADFSNLEANITNGFQKGKIDQTLFIKKQKGLQVKQKVDGIFISQDKYVAEILRKFGLTNGKSSSTPIDTDKPLLKDPDGEDVDVHTYRSMIDSLMYLTSSRLDIMFAVCACACFQVTLKTVVATSSTKAEYVAAASYGAQVLWFQN